MAGVGDFLKAVGGLKPTGVTVNNVVQSQGNEGDESMAEIADMFVKAQEKLMSDQEKLSKKTVFDPLKQLDSNFDKYFNNLSDLSIVLDKFVDPNYRMNKEEANKMQSLLDQNAKLVGDIDKRRQDDLAFRKQLEKIERDNDFIFRNRGLVEEEQMRLAKKNNQDIQEMWSGIANNIGDLSTDVVGDLKTSLIEGIGGPVGAMSTRVLLPLMKQIKDAKGTKVVADRMKKLSGSVVGMFKRNKSDLSEVQEELGETLSEDLGESLSDIPEEINDPDQGSLRKKAVKEERASQAVEARKQRKGVFREMVEHQQETNRLLSSLGGTLKSDLSDLDQAYTEIAKAQKTDTSVENLEEINEHLENSESLEDMRLKFMEEIHQLLEDNEDMDEDIREMNERDEEKKENDEVLAERMLEELEEIKDKTGGGVTMMGGIMGKLLPLLGLLATGVGAAAIGAGAFSLISGKEKKKAQERDTALQMRLELMKMLPAHEREKYSEIEEQFKETQKIENEQKRSFMSARLLEKFPIGDLVTSLFGKKTRQGTVVDVKDVLASGIPISEDQLRDISEKEGVSLKIGGETITGDEPWYTFGRKESKAVEELEKQLGKDLDVALRGGVDLTAENYVTNLIQRVRTAKDQQEARIEQIEKEEAKQLEKAKRAIRMTREEAAGGSQTSVSTQAMSQRNRKRLDDIPIQTDNLGMMLMNSGKL